MLRFSVRSWLRTRGRPLLWTYHPFIGGLREFIDPSCLIYHCVDDIAAIPDVDADAFAKAEHELLRHADLVFTTSKALQDHCGALTSSEVLYLPNVADRAFFATARASGPLPDDLARIPSPRICYSGMLTEHKVDLGLIGHVAQLRPDWSIVLIGDEPAGQASKSLERMRGLLNVYMLGRRQYRCLPQYLRGIDVALLPLLANAQTEAVFPMKYFEYLAAGLPVVASPIAALEDFAHCHVVASSPEGFVASIEDAINNPLRIAVDDPVLIENDWEYRLDRMLAAIDRLGLT